MSKDVCYYFERPDGSRWPYRVELEATGNPAPTVDESNGDDTAWARLDYHQCEHCPLSTDIYRDCPLARAIQPILVYVGHAASHDTVKVRVETDEREVVKVTTMQRAVGSLFGVVSAFSGCPHTTLLRPLARQHLPFSTSEETVARVLGNYLTGQYLRYQHGLAADWSLVGLRELYRNLRKVNRGMSARVRGIPSDDAAANSMVLLDVLAADIEYALDRYEGELDGAFREFLAVDKPG